MQSAFLHCTNADWFPELAVAPARRLLFERDFGIADRDHPEQQRAAQPADRGAERHEGKEHQDAAIAHLRSGPSDHPGMTGSARYGGLAPAINRQGEGESDSVELDQTPDFSSSCRTGSGRPASASWRTRTATASRRLS